MDWLQFIVGMVSSVAWPVVVLTVVLMFRAQLARIVERLAHLKYKDLELEFEKVKQQAEQLQLEQEPQPPLIAPDPVFTSLEDQILDAVERAPSAAILLAWSGLETAIAAAVSRLVISPDSPSYRSPMRNIDMLARHGRLSKSHEKLLHEMRTLRNKVAHEQDAMLSISPEQALNYATTAVDLMKHFEGYQRGG
jgi:hypothetical protein